MYRFEFEPKGTVATKDAVPAASNTASSSATAPTLAADLCGRSVPIEEGTLRLLRQKAFKGESLIPVIPTQYALLSIPPTLDNEVPVERLQLSLNKLHASFPPPNPEIIVENIFHDRGMGSVYVILRASDGNVLLDILSFYHTTTDPFLDDGNLRRVIALPCDTRPVSSVGTGFMAEFFYIPTCALCCDRLERDISGLHREVCDCGDNAHCMCHATSCCDICKRLVWGAAPSTACEVCQSSEAWICLICGFIGCSRYHREHAKQHYLNSDHEFSLSLTTQQVWDYAADTFVHRMLVMANASSGKPERLELPRSAEEFPDASKFGDVSKTLVDAKLDVKVEQCCMEYARLLTSQLDSQRRYFEGLLDQQHGPRPTASSTGEGGGGSAEKKKRGSKPPALGPHQPFSLDDMFGELQKDVAVWKRSNQEWKDAETNLMKAFVSKKDLNDNEQKLLSNNERLREDLKTLLGTQQEEFRRLQAEVHDMEEMIQQTKLNIKASEAIKKKASTEEVQKSVTIVQDTGVGKKGGNRRKK